MNPGQMAQQVKSLLQGASWQGGSAEPVFGSNVFVYGDAAVSEEDHPAGFPFALVTIDGGEPDGTHPDLLDQDFTVVLASEASGDPLGEHAIIGSSRADIGSSAGAGIVEVEARARAAIENLTGMDGAPVIVSAATFGTRGVVGRGRHIAFAELRLSAVCVSRPYYSEPQEVAVTDTNWTFRTEHIESRFDFMQYRIGYVAGSTPARNVADTTIVDTSATMAGLSHAPLAGRAYSVFADYSSRQNGMIEGTSDGDIVGAFITT